MRARLLFLLLFLVCAPLGALDRNAFTFVVYDLRMTLDPPQQAMHVEGRITLRNDSPWPQRSVALQVSSSLEWKSIGTGGRRVTFASQPYISDADHTGELSQAVFALPQAVPPGGTVQIEVAYSGKVLLESGRLERLNTPKDQALRRDWDRISPEFTALRGVGYVVWYPVALEGATLAQADSVSRTLADWKRRHARSSMNLELGLAGTSRIVANSTVQNHSTTFNGDPQLLPPFTRAAVTWDSVGLTSPAILAGAYQAQDLSSVSVLFLPPQETMAGVWAAALKTTSPYIVATSPVRVQIADLPDDDAVPFESGNLFMIPIRQADAAQLAITLAHPVMHAHFRSPRPWLHEGTAHFAQAVERERRSGRDAALDYMRRQLPALLAFEKEAGKSADPLITSFDEPLFRTKAMYVLWMLRDMVGDEALRSALTSYHPDKDTQPKYFQRGVESIAKRDLAWFFDDWVYGPGTLPALRLASVFHAKNAAGTFTVTLTIENTGSAAEVPVTLRSANGERTERVLVRARDKTVARIPLPEEPLEVRVNDGSVPEGDRTDNLWRSAPLAP